MPHQPDDLLPLADLVVLDLTVARADPPPSANSPTGEPMSSASNRPASASPTRPPRTTSTSIATSEALALDLKSSEGRAVLHRLVGRADILMENMRPTVKYKLGFDWDTVTAINPRLIMGSISGFGQTGPYAERGGVDQIAQGMSGMMSVTGLPGQGPVRAGAAISDIAAGLQLAIGVLVAVHERQRTGVGRWVHTSLLESMIGMLDFQAARWTVDHEIPPQAGNDHPTLRPMGLYPTADGHLNVAAAWGHLWSAFCQVIGRPDLPDDERFATPAGRKQHHDELTEIIATALAARTTAEWVELLNEVGVPAGPVNDLQQTFTDPQVQHLGVATPTHHPVSGDVEIIRNATTLAGVADDIRTPSPLAGEHSTEILAQFGFDNDETNELLALGVIADRHRTNRQGNTHTPTKGTP
ncbi:MAG: CoA transferase [Acidimicrobiales bacterium]